MIDLPGVVEGAVYSHSELDEWLGMCRLPEALSLKVDAQIQDASDLEPAIERALAEFIARAEEHDADLLQLPVIASWTGGWLHVLGVARKRGRFKPDLTVERAKYE
jgi:hypothetical protein